MSIVSFVSKLLSISSLQPRQSHDFPDYITVLSEPAGSCYAYPDSLWPSNGNFREDDSVNVTCWTLSSMLDDDIGRHWDWENSNSNSSFVWVWVALRPETFSQPWREESVGNLDAGGIAGGHGCWMHEDEIKNGDDLYLPDEIRWCGDAPHHQVDSYFLRARRKSLWGKLLADRNGSGSSSWRSRRLLRQQLRLSQLYRSRRACLPDHIPYRLAGCWRLYQCWMLEARHGIRREYHLGFSHPL